ncbi:hypothetical protein TNCV_2611301 [Trichonephila clavipes]|nr:hypothetical protein TNCV_2611301 [Trichonephila clavipes]
MWHQIGYGTLRHPSEQKRSLAVARHQSYFRSGMGRTRPCLEEPMVLGTMSGETGGETGEFRSIPTSLCPPPAKKSVPCACSEPWVHFRENFTKQKRHASEKKGESIDLQTPCFSHGQLYVACSRVGREENLFVHTPNGTAKNVVYPIALR